MIFDWKNGNSEKSEKKVECFVVGGGYYYQLMRIEGNRDGTFYFTG